jgi:hypothetical protein
MSYLFAVGGAVSPQTLSRCREALAARQQIRRGLSDVGLIAGWTGYIARDPPALR